MSEQLPHQDVIVGDNPAEIAARVAGTATYTPLYPAKIDGLLRMGDDALILTQRLLEWSFKAPVLEEDIAISNTGLDLLGQARMLYTYAGSLMDPAKSEDDLAYWRSGAEFRCAHIVQIENGDFAETVARNLAFALYQQLLYGALQRSTDSQIAAIAKKSSKEVAYHVDHFSLWALRLGDGTDESHARMQAGFDRIWPYVAELFDADAGVEATGGPTDALFDELVADGTFVDTKALHEPWLARMTATIETSTCTVPTTKWHARGGRRGEHTAHLDRILAEMQSVARAYPDATW
ncbi:1,2-phenylacetyl-CoA epoxidase subunit PaaC [Blastococcus sp. Marseille-P5729]|uniref:1,2-phenylacetyl-CoA epoxidase subunit PaaC n=1 Tax=Blastococcus sp. Marseille-P5729 TaxID=2086582 RepID=UPI000D10D4C1|nr:1,2-phenylacetyl-CoA epoxidase subunit PaaC [Blastococcus sp. Marseille-P5729]